MGQKLYPFYRCVVESSFTKRQLVFALLLALGDDLKPSDCPAW